MGEEQDLIAVTADPLDAGSLIGCMRCDSSGALAVFVGVVRDEHQGHKVHHLIYEAYPPMAQQEMRRIAAEARGRWRLDRMAIAHRIGRLEIGEASVVIVVAAPHRREALEACAFCIERVKQAVPIWKKEFGEHGEEWIVGDPSAP